MSELSETELEDEKLIDEIVNKTAPSEQLEGMTEAAASGMSDSEKSVPNKIKKKRGRPAKEKNIIESENKKPSKKKKRIRLQDPANSQQIDDSAPTETIKKRGTRKSSQDTELAAEPAASGSTSRESEGAVEKKANTKGSDSERSANQRQTQNKSQRSQKQTSKY